MGNQAVYSQGLFIEPNKIHKKNLQIDTKKIDIENFFGRIDIPTARAQKGNDTIIEDLKTSYVTRVQHYQNQKQIIKPSYKVKQKRQKRQQSVLVQVNHHNSNNLITNVNKPDHSNIKQVNLYLPTTHQNQNAQRRAKTQLINSKATHSADIDINKYMTRNDSPIKQENKTPEESQILVFQSRLQNKYFKISK